MYNIYLLRHGRSLAGDENKFEGRYDSPLIDVGRAQTTKETKELKFPLLRLLQIEEKIKRHIGKMQYAE